MQNTYSQNKEDLFVLDYFGDYKGTLLSIGENDGTTFSNARLLIENGWSAFLVEPGETREQLKELHRDNMNVIVFNVAIGSKEGIVSFYESGAHVPHGTDRGLVSTTNAEEVKRWPNVAFTRKEIKLVSFSMLYEQMGKPKLDFISIDTEGDDILILKQIDLEKVGCKCLIVEWNSNTMLLDLFVDYCKDYNLVVKNAENLIFTKKSIIERMSPIIKQMDETILKTQALINRLPKIGVGVTKKGGEVWPGVDLLANDTHYIINTDQITVARDKNQLIKRLYDAGCDYIVIFDQDCFPIKEGWEQFFIEASRRTGVQHFILGNDEHLRLIDFANGLNYYHKGTGCMLFLTRAVIEKVGYINNKYGKYGYEHAAYSLRIHRAGLTPSWYVSVDGWEEYVYSWDLQKEEAGKHHFTKLHTLTEPERLKYIAENECEWRKEQMSPRIYYDYEQTQAFTKAKKKVFYYALQPGDTTSFQRIHGVLPYIKHDDFFLIDISYHQNFNETVLKGCSVLILQRPFTADHCKLIILAKQMGIKIILDYDDDLYNVDMFNPTHQMYQQFQQSITDAIGMADELWVSTEAIKQSYKHLNAHVIPNCHNEYIFPLEDKLPFRQNKKVIYRGGGCYDEETQVLTCDRFKYFRNLSDLDLIATRTPTGELEYVRIDDYIEYHHDGVMHHYQNGYIDSLVTPNHSVYHATKRHEEYSLKKSSELFGNDLHFRKDCKWIGKNCDTFEIPKIKETGAILTWERCDYIKFFGFWLADGWSWSKKNSESGQVGFAMFKGDEVNFEIIRIFEKYNFKYTKRHRNGEFNSIVTCDNNLFKHFEHLGKAHNKYIPGYILELPSESLKLFLEWYLKGDGSSEKAMGRKNPRIRAYTSSKRLADGLVEIALKIGWAASIKNRGKRVGGSKNGVSIQARFDAYDVSFYQDNIDNYLQVQVKSKDQKIVNYDGMVYCVTVKNHLLYVKRNGKCYWSGNSHRADVYEYSEKLVDVINNNLNWTFQFIGDRYEWLEQRTGDNHEIIPGLPMTQYYAYVYQQNPSAFIFPLCNTPFNKAKSNICWLEATFCGAAFFGSTILPEFNKPGTIDLRQFPAAISGDHWKFMKEKNEESWQYITENLLLSEINKLRVERILANL